MNANKADIPVGKSRIVLPYDGVRVDSTAVYRSRASFRRVTLIEALLLTHLVVVAFQLPIRSIIFDTTFLRDIFLFSAAGLWILSVLRGIVRGEKSELNQLDILFGGYLLYGCLELFIGFGGGLGIVEAASQIRNFFCPAMLYFVARIALRDPFARRRLLKVMLWISIAYIVDVVIEFALLHLGMSNTRIPWYTLVFRVSDRYIGNEIGAAGYIDTFSYLQVLGFLAWQHATAATLMALFAFSYPFWTIGRLQNVLGYDLGFIGRLPNMFRSFILVSGVLAVGILNVKVHLVSLVLVMVVLSFLLFRDLRLRHLRHFVLATVVLIASESLYSNVIADIRQGFESDPLKPSGLDLVIDLNDFKSLIDRPVLRILFGNVNFSGSDYFEIRILQFFLNYGLVWLLLAVGSCVTGLTMAWMIAFDPSTERQAHLFAIGTIGLLVVYIVDMFHYATTMYLPNIDFWSVCLGAISVLWSTRRQRSSTRVAMRI